MLRDCTALGNMDYNRGIGCIALLSTTECVFYSSWSCYLCGPKGLTVWMGLRGRAGRFCGHAWPLHFLLPALAQSFIQHFSLTRFIFAIPSYNNHENAYITNDSASNIPSYMHIRERRIANAWPKCFFPQLHNTAASQRHAGLKSSIFSLLCLELRRLLSTFVEYICTVRSFITSTCSKRAACVSAMSECQSSACRIFAARPASIHTMCLLELRDNYFLHINIALLLFCASFKLFQIWTPLRKCILIFFAAFHQPQKMFTEPTMLVHVNPSRRLYIDIDASKLFGCGAIIYHASRNSRTHCPHLVNTKDAPAFVAMSVSSVLVDLLPLSLLFQSAWSCVRNVPSGGKMQSTN